MDESSDFHKILRFHNKLEEIKEEINKINEKQEESLARYKKGVSKEEPFEGARARGVAERRVGDDKEIDAGRFGKLGDDKEIDAGRFGKLGDDKEIDVGSAEFRFSRGDDLFADGILSVFNNIDENKSSLLKVEKNAVNIAEELQDMSRIRNNLEKVISSFGSVVDEHIEVNDKNCSHCACEKMDESFYFIASLRGFSNEGLTELRNKMEREEDKFWAGIGLGDLNSEKKKQLISLVNVLSKT